VIQCHTIDTLLRTCAVAYTRNTFLYRRVNQFLRVSTDGQTETGRNLGLYIGLLRECFCVSAGSSPLSWECPTVVYRGAHFPVDILADYARRPDELIRWQGFTSSSRDMKVALGFPGNVLFEVALRDNVASLDEMSAFKHEHEYVLSPYQWFSLSVGIPIASDGFCRLLSSSICRRFVLGWSKRMRPQNRGRTRRDGLIAFHMH
jgi:hypothetical protein